MTDTPSERDPLAAAVDALRAHARSRVDATWRHVATAEDGRGRDTWCPPELDAEECATGRVRHAGQRGVRFFELVVQRADATPSPSGFAYTAADFPRDSDWGARIHWTVAAPGAGDQLWLRFPRFGGGSTLTRRVGAEWVEHELPETVLEIGHETALDVAGTRVSVTPGAGLDGPLELRAATAELLAALVESPTALREAWLGRLAALERRASEALAAGEVARIVEGEPPGDGVPPAEVRLPLSALERDEWGARSRAALDARRALVAAHAERLHAALRRLLAPECVAPLLAPHPPRRPGIYAICVDLRDGTSVFPAKVPREGPHWERELDEATRYYARVYAGLGDVTVHYATRLAALPLPNAATLRPWSEVRREIPPADLAP